VGSLTVIGSSLYVGGTFTQTSDGAVTGLNSIAVYKGGAWSALAHGGLASTGGQATVWASTANGSDLYVGGAFTRTADGVLTGLNCIAWYNTLTGAWSPLSHYGLDKMVFSLAAGGGNLYVGGWLTKTADGAVTGLNSFATYNLAAGIWMAPANQGLTVFSPPASVLAILPIGNTLYAGGYFDRTMDGTVTNMAGVASLPIPKLVTGPYHDYLPTLTR
jgi:hypothetical protein